MEIGMKTGLIPTAVKSIRFDSIMAQSSWASIDCECEAVNDT